MTEQDNQKFVELIKSHEPSATNVEFIEHGYHNIVANVDKKLVFRFPRNEQAQYWLITEALILQELNGRLPNIPKALHLSRNPAYSVQSYLSGQHLTDNEIANLPDEKQYQIASELAQFIVDYNQLLPPDKLKEIRQQSGLVASGVSESWPVYLERILAKTSYPNYPEIEKLAKHYYQEWQQVTASDDLPQMTLHDDLHLHNILFQDGQISGILDFGDSAIGTANEEMRNFYPFGDNFLTAAAKKYAQLSGQRVDPKKAKTWAITTNLASLAKRISADMTDSPGFIRAQKNLKKWGIINDVA